MTNWIVSDDFEERFGKLAKRVFEERGWDIHDEAARGERIQTLLNEIRADEVWTVTAHWVDGNGHINQNIAVTHPNFKELD